MRFSKRICEFWLVFLLLVASLATLMVTAQEVDEEREFSYDEKSETGPSKWGKIRPEWHNCSSGEMQSPIDLLHQRVQIVSHLGKLERNYKPAKATLINRGHDMMLRWINDAGHIRINGTIFHLRQCHWHTPSEHTINGRNSSGSPKRHRTAVIGIMYKIGRPDYFISMLKPGFVKLSETEEVEKSIGVVDPDWIKFGSRKYYRYMGSLTTPPCTPGVIWTIVKKVKTVTRDQVKLIREALHDPLEVNARPIQATNGRSIEMYRPRDLEN